MRRGQTETVRTLRKRAKHTPRRAQTTKQRHQGLLRALGDRRLKRAFNS